MFPCTRIIIFVCHDQKEAEKVQFSVETLKKQVSDMQRHRDHLYTTNQHAKASKQYASSLIMKNLVFFTALRIRPSDSSCIRRR
jgi:hypothetical protein